MRFAQGAELMARPATGARPTAALRAWVCLLRVHKTLLAAVRQELLDDVTLPRFDLLANLDHKDGQTLASLSRSMLVTAGNLTGLVDRAERDGLVERRDDSHDRRATHVFLTRRGRKVFGNAQQRHAARVEERFAELSTAELLRLTQTLDKILTGGKVGC